MKYPGMSALTREARRRCRLSRVNFAKRLWTSTRAVAHWEDGEKKPTGATIRLLMAIRDGSYVLTEIDKPKL